MKPRHFIIHEQFGKKKRVRARIHNMHLKGEYKEVLFVSRTEDEYALSSPQLRDIKVAVVYREDWLNAEELIDES